MLRSASVIVLAGLAVSANAGIFSFASDFSDESWTWHGELHGGHFGLSDGTPTGDLMQLLIDDANGVLDPLVFDVDFNAHLHFAHLSSTPIGGGKFLHSYAAEGDVGWYTDSGPVLEMSTDGAVFTIVGGEFSWDSAGSIFGADSWASLTYTSYVDAPAYGMFAGQNVSPADFGFTLTALNSSGVIPYDFSSPGAALDPSSMLPLGDIFAEGSFSGSAQFVPAPTSLALLGAAGLMSGSRRRRARVPA
jgi:hypothetical protein